MDKTVELIRNAGGIAILAHWETIKNKIDIEMLEQFLKEKRLDGLEVIDGLNIDNIDQVKLLKKLAEQTGVLQTVGIDAHKPEGFEKFANEKALAEQSIGITQNIIEHVHPPLQWSNLKEPKNQ